DSQQTPDATAVPADFGVPGNFTVLNNMANNNTTTNTPAFQRQVRIYDSLGTPPDLNLSFVKIAPSASGQVGFTLTAPAADGNAANMPAGAAGANSVVGYGTVTFNGDGSLNAVNMVANDGTPAWAATASNTAQIAWSNGANNSTMALNFGTVGKTDGMTQF